MNTVCVYMTAYQIREKEKTNEVFGTWRSGRVAQKL